MSDYTPPPELAEDYRQRLERAEEAVRQAEKAAEDYPLDSMSFVLQIARNNLASLRSGESMQPSQTQEEILDKALAKIFGDQP